MGVSAGRPNCVPSTGSAPLRGAAVVGGRRPGSVPGQGVVAGGGRGAAERRTPGGATSRGGPAPPCLLMFTAAPDRSKITILS